MTSKTVIVVFGNMAAGKSTLAGIMRDLSGGTIINFADRVKQVAKDMVGIPLKVSHGSQETKASFAVYGKSAREHLQWIGTEVGRDGVAKTVWADRFVDAVFEAPEDVVIAGDGRYPDEELHYVRRAVEARGGKVYGVVIRRPGIEIDLSHRSESVIAETPDEAFDVCIHNNTTLEDLREAAQVSLTLIDVLPRDGRDRGPHYIKTFSGRKFWPLDPRPEDVCLEDIAHGLALENRWSGFTIKPLNVAWHSLIVGSFVDFLAPDSIKNEARLYALLHDAHEAYLKDVPRPVKALTPEYEKAAERLDAVIFEHFGLAPVMPSEIAALVEKVDRYVAFLEAWLWHPHVDPDEVPYEPLDVEVPAQLKQMVSELPAYEADESKFLWTVRVAHKSLEKDGESCQK